MVNRIGLYTLVRRELERVFRVATQTLVTPWISALLYIFIFGFVVGKRIDLIAGVPYIQFVLPGIIMMNVISAAFFHTSSSLYFHRFLKTVEEMLTAPLSYLEMILGYLVGAVIRAAVVGAGIFAIAIGFGAARVDHIGLFMLYVVVIAAIFALVGLFVGLWANNFEQLNVLNTFVIMPLSFLGGVFYSVEMLPPTMQVITKFNPFFYFIDGIRYSMIGIQEADPFIGAGIIIVLLVGLCALIVHLFRIGWRIRE